MRDMPWTDPEASVLFPADREQNVFVGARRHRNVDVVAASVVVSVRHYRFCLGFFTSVATHGVLPGIGHDNRYGVIVVFASNTLGESQE